MKHCKRDCDLETNRFNRLEWSKSQDPSREGGFMVKSIGIRHWNSEEQII